jgi:hypothetical protein
MPLRAVGVGARLLLVPVLGLLLATGAAAQMFVCKKDGHTITRDVPPPECKDVEVRELNVDGSLKRVIPAPLTREERRRRDQEEKARLLDEENERAQAYRDRALLETYGSIEEIEATRRRNLAGRQLLVDRADQRIAQYQREKKRLDEEAEFYAKKEMPTKLKDAFEANKVLVDQQQKTRADALVEMQRINERFDADVARYRELQEMAARAAAERERAADQQ